MVLPLLGLFFLALYFPVIFQGKTLFFRDITQYALPMKQFIAQSFARGELPFWWPGVLGGTPFLALMHPGVFYPLNLLFLAVADFITAFNLYMMLHTLILTFSVYALCRHWRLSVEASLCSAVTALFGGYFLSVTEIYSHIASAAWAPLCLLFIDRSLTQGGARNFVFALLALVMQVLAGAPELCILSVLLCYAYAIVLVPEKPGEGGGWREKTAAVSALVLLALGLCALQLLPTYHLMSSLMRNDGIDYSLATQWSAGGNVLSSMMLPDRFLGETGRVGFKFGQFLQNYYLGLFPLAVLLLALAGGLDGRAVHFWAAVFIVGLFFSLGKYNPLYEWLYRWVPLLSKFRYPEKFLFLSAFAGVFLAGYGYDALINGIKSRRVWLVAVLAGVVLAAMVVAVGAWKPGRQWLEALVLLAGFALSMVAFSQGKLTAPLFKTAILAVVCLDLVARNLGTVPMIDRDYVARPPEVVEKIPLSPTPYRIYSGVWSRGGEMLVEPGFGHVNFVMVHLNRKHSLSPNLGTLYGFSYFDGFTGLDTKDFAISDYYFRRSGEAVRRSILARSNVRYIVRTQEAKNPTLRRPFDKVDVEELPNALPRAYLVGGARVVPYPKVVDEFYDPAFDARKEVLLVEPVDLKSTDDFEGQVVALDHTPNRVTIKTRQNGDGFLMLLDSYFPGWTVRVDGEPGEIHRGNYFFRAVKLGPGEHKVEFSFLPEGFKPGCAISFATLLVIAVIALLPALRFRLLAAR